MKTDRGISNSVAITGNDQVHIYYSNGFGPKGKDSKADVAAFLEKHRSNPDIGERLHTIWYFHDCSKGVVEESEKELFKMDFGDIPVMVVLQNEDSLRASFFGNINVKEEEYGAEAKATTAFASALDKIMNQLPLPKKGKYVHTKNGKTSVTLS